jgi:hypothetical protein
MWSGAVLTIEVRGEREHHDVVGTYFLVTYTGKELIGCPQTLSAGGL